MNDYFKPFDRSNIAETPNPKPLSVQRVSVSMEKSEKAAPSRVTSNFGFVRNANLHPEAHTRSF